jgi:N-acetyl-anhydromuramyl-L-alanine amidase AmpD
MRKIEAVVIHTAAHGNAEKGEQYDTSAEQIDAWHRDRGWNDIGYHWVVRRSGKIEPGRPESRVGAHVKGHNARTIGICLSGHGDVGPATPEQWDALVSLVGKIVREYGLDVFTSVLPHNHFTNAKTCPGKYIDIGALRFAVVAEVGDYAPVGEWDAQFEFNEEEFRPLDMELQRFLNQVGESVTVDGFAGEETSAAVKRCFGFYLAGDPRRIKS